MESMIVDKPYLVLTKQLPFLFLTLDYMYLLEIYPNLIHAILFFFLHSKTNITFPQKTVSEHKDC
jgi:hypothetical protein